MHEWVIIIRVRCKSEGHNLCVIIAFGLYRLCYDILILVFVRRLFAVLLMAQQQNKTCSCHSNSVTSNPFRIYIFIHIKCVFEIYLVFEIKGPIGRRTVVFCN